MRTNEKKKKIISEGKGEKDKGSNYGNAPFPQIWEAIREFS
jgi:hypothetical protein